MSLHRLARTRNIVSSSKLEMQGESECKGSVQRHRAESNINAGLEGGRVEGGSSMQRRFCSDLHPSSATHPLPSSVFQFGFPFFFRHISVCTCYFRLHSEIETDIYMLRSPSPAKSWSSGSCYHATPGRLVEEQASSSDTAQA